MTSREALNQYFVRRCREGLRRRGLADREPYRRQLEAEIQVIVQLDFAGYFLIVADMVSWAREQGIPVGPGRGSAAGSLVAYVLEITDIDPLKYRLFFERFLNPARVSPPDIDVDFSKSRRDEVLDYLRRRYGEDRVAQIATFSKLFAKQAVRDVGRVLGRPYADVDELAKLIPPPLSGRQMTLPQAYELVPELKRRREEGDEVLRWAEKLEGLAKSLSTHAAGVVISDQPLFDCLPLANSKGVLITQFDMKDLEALGFIKFDVLALKNLDVIADCVRLVREHRGEDVDWRRIPDVEDPAAFEYLKEGRFGGIFQLEATRGMRELILELQPRSIEDLSAALALFRPGPLGAGMKDRYLAVRSSREAPAYLVPELEPILDVTCGQLLYQEQVLEICKQLAGYSLAEADLMRRAIGKKNPQEMAAQKAKFVQGMLTNGYSREVAEKLFAMIETFADYGFNKAHSVAYATITYITAYLKARYRLEFYVALLNHTKEASERDKFFGYLLELRDEGIQILPPDVNRSEVDFSLDGGAIRYGLSGIRNVGEAAAAHLVEVRRRQPDGCFSNLRELVEAVDPRQVNVKVLEALAYAGCFDSWGHDRRTLAENCRPFLDMVRKLNRKVPAIHHRRERERQRVMALAEAKPRQHGGKKLEQKLVKIEDRFRQEIQAINQEYEQILSSLEAKEPYTRQELLRLEKELLGFYLTGHPVDYHLQAIRKRQALRVTELVQLTQEPGAVKVAGAVGNLKSRLTRQKKLMYTFVLEDAFSALPCTVFPSAADRLATVMVENSCVAATGVLRRRLDSEGAERLEFVVNDLEPLDGEEAAVEPLRFIVELSRLGPEQFQELHRLLTAHPGEQPVECGLHVSAGLLVFSLGLKVDGSPELREALRNLPWVGVL